MALTAKRPSANGIEKSLKDMQEETTRFNVDLPKSMHKKLKLLSVETGDDMTVIVRRWIAKELGEQQ